MATEKLATENISALRCALQAAWDKLAVEEQSMTVPIRDRLVTQTLALVGADELGAGELPRSSAAAH